MSSSFQSVQTAVAVFIEQHGLPAAYADNVERWLLPLSEDILRKVSVHTGPFVLGIHGTQGSGKSTLAALLVMLLRELMGLRSMDLSLDDFYLTRADREVLATTVHPLLQTRGVPGTHDIALALQTLAGLKTAGEVAIPRFNKAIDDRFDRDDWPRVQGPVDVIILEGWCLGVRPQNEAELRQAVNALEREEDADGHWRHFVNDQLAGHYQRLFEQLDLLLMLKAPSFECVQSWRQQQEEKLAARVTAGQGTHLMSPAQLKRFISHYERLTRHALLTVPEQADIVFQLATDQGIESRIKG